MIALTEQKKIVNKPAARKPLTVFAWAKGLLEFGYRVPDGALPVASSHDEERLRDLVDVWARHSRTTDALLVPGIPESQSSDEALAALMHFSERIKTGLSEEKASG